MVRIRLARHGKRNDPFYRVVVVDRNAKVTGAPIDVIGHWYPAKDTKKLDKKKFEDWVKKGARASATVEKLFAK